MIKQILPIFLLLVTLSSSLFATHSDTLVQLRTNKVGYTSKTTKQPLFEYGFQIGVNLTSPQTLLYKDGVATERLIGQFSGEFAGFFRAGKFVYGEIGIGYQFQKGTYQNQLSLLDTTSSRVELRYLIFPIKAVGNIPLNKKLNLQPHLGIIYQPLIQITDNYIGYNRNTITCHQLFFTGGIGLKINYFTIGVAYRHAFFSYFQDKESKKIGFMNLQIGFVF